MSKTPHQGFTLVEISAAVALLAVCLLSFAQLVALNASERVSERTRQTAVDQLQNVFERLLGTLPEKIAAGDFDKADAESLIEHSLPDGKIFFDTKTVEPDVLVFTATVSWNDGEKRPRKIVAMCRLLTVPKKGGPTDVEK